MRYAGYYLAAQVIPLVIGVAITPYLLGLLGNQRFALLTLAWLLANYFTLFDFGISRGMTHFISQARARYDFDEIRRTWWTAVALQTIVACAATAVIIAGGNAVWSWGETAAIGPLLGATSETRILFYFAALSIPASVVGLALRGHLEAHRRFGSVSLIRGAVAVGAVVVPAIVVSLGGDLGVSGLCFAAVQVVATATYAVLGLAQLPRARRRPAFSREVVRRLIAYGWPVTLTGIVVPLVRYADRFMISAIRPLGELPYYSVPSDGVIRLDLIPASVSATTFPGLSASTSMMDAESVSLYVRSARLVLVSSSAIALIVVALAHPLMAIWLGVAFSERSAFVLQVLTTAYLLEATTWASNTLLFAVGKPRLVATLFLITFIVSIPVTLLGLLVAGIKGAAVGTFFRCAFEAALFGTFAGRFLPSGVSFLGFEWRRASLLLVTILAVLFSLIILTNT